MSRDLVRWLPNERVDLPDLVDLQQNARSESHVVPGALATGSFGATMAGHRRILGGFAVGATSPASSAVTVASGRALGVVVLPDGTYEPGVVIGADGVAQNVDFAGQPNGTYSVWIRYSADPGESGNRIFWSPTPPPGAEVVQTLATRFVVSWDLAVSAASPGTEWEAIASVVWGGSTVVAGNITKTRRMFFEGTEPAYAYEWGDGVNDRNVDRATYGVTDLWTMVQALRRQIEEIVGDGQKWYENFTRISATQFEIESATGRYWNVDEFVHRGDAFLNTAAGLQLIGTLTSGAIAVTSRSGADVTVEAIGGGSVRLLNNPVVPNNVTFATAKAFEHVIAGVCFTPDMAAAHFTTGSYHTSVDNATPAYKTVLGDSTNGGWTVSLDFVPHGAELNDIFVRGRVLWVDCTLDVFVSKVHKTTGARTTIASDNVSGAGDFGGAAPRDFQNGGTDGFGTVIDLATYAYFVQIAVHNDNSAGAQINGQFWLYCLRARWTQATMQPVV